MTGPQRVDGSVEFVPGWFVMNGCLPLPNPMEADFDQLAELEQQRRSLLAKRFPDLNLVDPRDEAVPAIEWPYTELMVCCAYGADYPRWNGANGHWWHDRDFWPWTPMETIDDVRHIQVPRWENVPQIEALFRRLEEAGRAFPGSSFAPGAFGWTHPHTGQHYEFSHVITYIDLGPFLMGTVPFFTLLAGNPEVADALMDKAIEVTTGICDFYNAHFGRSRVEGISSLVGNFGTFMSPRTYERYSLPADMRVLDRYGGRHLPCNLHSCGPSSHLYDYWSQFPNVPVMQTRGIPGQTARLRAAMPDTYLHITLHPPQLDWETSTPEAVRQAVWEYSEAAGYRDVQLHLMVSGHGGAQGEDNLRVFRSTLDEVNRSLGQPETLFIHGYGV